MDPEINESLGIKEESPEGNTSSQETLPPSREVNDLEVGKEATRVAVILAILTVVSASVGLLLLFVEDQRFTGILLLNGAILMKIYEKMLIFLQAIAYNTQQLRLEK